MDHAIICFTCEKCKTSQEHTLTWKPSATPNNPTKGNKSKAQVTCRACGHKQTVPV